MEVIMLSLAIARVSAEAGKDQGDRVSTLKLWGEGRRELSQQWLLEFELRIVE
jgi:uncharacterized protein YeaO (DUF488 family)